MSGSLTGCEACDEPLAASSLLHSRKQSLRSQAKSGSTELKKRRTAALEARSPTPASLTSLAYIAAASRAAFPYASAAVARSHRRTMVRGVTETCGCYGYR
jgi:hypothetical protein